MIVIFFVIVDKDHSSVNGWCKNSIVTKCKIQIVLINYKIHGKSCYLTQQLKKINIKLINVIFYECYKLKIVISIIIYFFNNSLKSIRNKKTAIK